MKPRVTSQCWIDQTALDTAAIEVWYNPQTNLPSTAVVIGDLRIIGASTDIQPGVFADCLRYIANRIDDEFSALIREDVESGF